MRSGSSVLAACVGVALVLGGTVVLAELPDAGRVLSKEVVVAAPRHDVWRAWTTADGVCSFFGSKANIELRVGGPYEILFMLDAEAGQRGGEGCRVLSFIPEEKLSFEWNFPPSIPSLRKAGAKTQVALQFDELPENQTRVCLTQRGWGEGTDWDAGYAYFDSAWSGVLERFRDRFAPTIANTEDGPQTINSWLYNDVVVTSIAGVDKRQEFEIDLPVPVSRVWNALTTRDGIRAFLAPDPKVELKIGGSYDLYGKTKSNVLAFVSNELLVVTGSAPLEFPNVRMEGTSTVIDLEATSESSCHVRMLVTGWQEGDDWDRAFEYFLRNNAVFLDLLHDRFTEGPLVWRQEEGAPNPMFKRLPLSEDKPVAPAAGEPIQRTDRVFLLDADVATVWGAFTAKHQLSAWAGPVGDVELRAEGAYEPLSDSGMKGAKVLTYQPERLLAHEGDLLSGGKGRAWVVWRFEPVATERVRVRFTALGKCSPEVWAKSLFANTNRMDRAVWSLKQHLEDAPKAGTSAGGS